MSDFTENSNLPAEQAAIRAKCFHPTGHFVEFTEKEIEQSIPERFEKIVKLHPDRLAIKSGNRSVTYNDLNKAAHWVANIIIDRCGNKQEPVALMFEDPLTMVAALLGSLRAGKFYVPLDLSYPKERIRYSIKDSGANLLLTDCDNDAWPTESRVDRILIDIGKLDWRCADNNREASVSPHSPAIIMYTSGSTGDPKGVVVSHRDILYGTNAYSNLIRLTPDDRLSLLHSFSFRAVQLHLFGALLNGGALFPFLVKRDGVRGLIDWLVAEGITILHLIPQLFRLFADSLARSDAVSTVRLLHLSGAPATAADLEQYKRYFAPDCILLHRMGTTETQTVSWCVMDHTSESADGSLPLGWPPAGQEVSLLDPSGAEVGTGETGEIVVKSRYLSTRYWNDPELTKEKFLHDQSSGQRIYLTGDLGRRTPRFGLVHLGRKDFQIKIRGFRVQLAEVEKALLSHTLVKEAIVVAKSDEAKSTTLIGYVTPKKDAQLATEDLRGHLERTLPDYMVPAFLVRLDSFPLTPNGKIDREELRKIDPRQSMTRPAYVVPRTRVENQVVQIWQEALGINWLSIHDNFFDLGGHSLVGMRILSRVADTFGVDVSMRHLLDSRTPAGLARIVESLQHTALREGAAPSLKSLALATEKSGSDLPLSYAEEGIWLLDQIQPGLSTWNMQTRLRLRGRLVFEALDESFKTLIQRHQILRTSYRTDDGVPTRVIAPSLKVELTVTPIDPTLDPDEQINRISVAAEKQPFNLAVPPLFRLHLIRLNELDHVLVITQHHIITDAVSSNLLIRELFNAYQAYSIGQKPQLPDLPVQYPEYARWVRQDGSQGIDHLLRYWREKLQGYAIHELPADMPHPVQRRYRRDQERIQFSDDVSRRLRVLCTTEGTTIFMLLLAAFKLLLGRYTGAKDVIVGSAVAGRNHSELENLIGMFINILVLRTDWSGSSTFRQLLNQVRETCLEAYQHQNLAIEKLVKELNPTRGWGRPPFFQVLFNVVSVPSIQRQVDGLTIETLTRLNDAARFDLTIYAPEGANPLEIIAAYDRDLFSRQRIVELLHQYGHLLAQIADSPDVRLDDYSLVTGSAKKVLPDPTVPLDSTWYGAVHEFVMAYAKTQPDSLAVEDPHEAWSYKELNERSNQLAHYLLAHGVQREDIVAVYGERSAWLVWTLLGILKAGAAFLIIDPAHPAKRVRDYLDIARPKGLIQIGDGRETERDVEEFFQSLALRCRSILPQPSAARAAFLLQYSEYSTSEPHVTVSPDDLAYVIFTSGSTGKPKAVMGRHGPLTHFLPWLAETFGLSRNDRFSCLSAVSTNKLQRETFTALCFGGALYIPDAGVIGNFGKLDEWLNTKRITVVHLTPAMAQLLDETARQPSPTVRQVFFGGDLVRTRDVDRVRRLLPKADIANFYNSSETQRGGGYMLLSQPVLDGRDIPPLGCGVTDVQLLVLNPGGKMAGIGEIGEICVRSPHMARGYLRDETLTSERFIVNPFTGIQTDRIFRTGEHGRYLPNGQVEFVARGDNQASIRGFRVDVGEVESILMTHPAVSQAAVAVVADNGKSDRLVGFIVAKRGLNASVDDLRVFLKARLPDYTVPSRLIFLHSLPLLATGKIDRQALKAKAAEGSVLAARPELRRGLVPPRTATETTIAEIWQAVLGLDQVGVHDNFFELGGHSLAAARVVSQVLKTFQLDLPLQSLFVAPTVAEMAVVIAEHQGKQLHPRDLDRVLGELESLSEQEAQRLLCDPKLGDRP